MPLLPLLLALVLLLAPLSLSAPTSDPTVSSPAFSNVLRAAHPLNILLTNDDSWASANIRSFYYALRAAGHRVLLVAPSHNQSGKGGTFELPTTLNLTNAGRGGFVPVGAPYFGRNATDGAIRYFNGTPAACAAWGLDHEAPAFFNANASDPTANVDLVVSGPNEGTNLGPFVFTLSGTVGASYFSVERSVPAIAFSASNSVPRNFDTLDFSDPSDEPLRLGRLSADLVTALGDATYPRGSSSRSKRLLPLGVGLNVNYPPVGPNSTCAKTLTFTRSRLTGGAQIDRLSVNQTTGLPTYANIEAVGLNTCINGDCSLPGETDVVAAQNKCQASVSIYATDYDAPSDETRKLAPTLDASLSKASQNQNGK